ncbi:MAG TPA: sugar transferase [Gemmataceae bacterium]|nr:sugar transferase [Gemmataceae bacterium]
MLVEIKPAEEGLKRCLPDFVRGAAVPVRGKALAQVDPREGPGRQALDVAPASLLLLCSWPVLLVAIALIKLTSRGAALYSQTRLGRGGKPFRIYKVRTMVTDCERASGPRWSTAGDPRVLPVGRLLRRTHVDELPQLWNVLRGDMSLVGPRPERPEFVPKLERIIPHYRDRLAVLPGLTGLAQIHLPPDSDLESVRRKLAFDLHYVHARSTWLDLRILAATFCKFFLPFGLHGILFRLPSQATAERTYRKFVRSALPASA